MAKIRSTLKLIRISTGNFDATKKGIGAMHHTIVRRACFLPQKVALAPEKPILPPDIPMVPYFSCKTHQKGLMASSTY